MKKVLLAALFCFSIAFLSAQPFQRKNIEFKKFGEGLKYALAGGLNTPQFSEIDLNNDGIKDMYIFERTGDVSLTFINEGTANEPDYKYAPQYQDDFPELNDWVLLRDYNGDGIEDIFAYSDTPGVDGIIAYKGYYTDNRLAFERLYFANDEYNFDVMPYTTSSGLTNIYISYIDYPAVDDIDGDGDLDILTFALGGGHVYLYNNQSVEMGHGKDSLLYVLEDVCWGRFYESGISEIIDLSPGVDSCVNGITGNMAEVRHAGSTLLTFDYDNDNDKELILGDLSFNNLNLLYNGGNNEFAYMVDQDTFSPKNTLEVDIPVFPVSFLMDVDNDGLKDLLASPNNEQTGEDYNAVWMYKNVNSNEFPTFQYIQKDFLVEHMIDLGTDAHPAFVDYNADGLMDLVVGNNSFYQPFAEKAPRIYLFENTGTLSSPEFNLVDDDYLDFSIYSGTNNYAPAPAFGDLDNDGDLDILIGEQSGSFFYAENTAGPGSPVSFGNLQPEYMGLDLGQKTVPQIVDLDRDGLPDIIAGERIGKVAYFHNEGTQNEPLFLPNIDSETPAGENIIALGFIDTRFGDPIKGRSSPLILDFDGEYHIFTGSEVGYLMHYSGIEGNINGAFTLETDFFGEIREGFNTHPAIIDIDDDGVLEMFIGNERGGLSLFKTNLNTDGTTVSTHYTYEQSVVNIYPNPASEYFNIEIKNGSNKLVNLSLFNSIGQEVVRKSFTTSNYQMNTNGLSNGIYIVRLETGGAVIVKKVVVR